MNNISFSIDRQYDIEQALSFYANIHPFEYDTEQAINFQIDSKDNRIWNIFKNSVIVGSFSLLSHSITAHTITINDSSLLLVVKRVIHAIPTTKMLKNSQQPSSWSIKQWKSYKNLGVEQVIKAISGFFVTQKQKYTTIETCQSCLNLFLIDPESILFIRHLENWQFLKEEPIDHLNVKKPSI
ncbi:MAG: hypothetical protein QRY74_00925 [Chlamydia sp.]